MTIIVSSLLQLSLVLQIFIDLLLYVFSTSPKVPAAPKSVEGPPPEDEPDWDQTTVVLDWYNSDLNLVISKTDFVSAAPLTDGGFAFMWAGARASYGYAIGKICYEIKVQR